MMKFLRDRKVRDVLWQAAATIALIAIVWFFVRNASVVDAMGMMPALVGRWQAANEKAYRLQAAASDQMGVIAPNA